MSNRYEQSLKEQAARIRRELAGERETKPVERPKKEEREDRFVLTDVPSPIYGFQRPKQSVPDATNPVEETENVNQVSDRDEEGIMDGVASNEQAVIVSEEVVLDESEADAGFVPVTDAELLVPEPEIDQDDAHLAEALTGSEDLVTSVEETESESEMPESIVPATSEPEEASEQEATVQTDSREVSDERLIVDQEVEDTTVAPSSTSDVSFAEQDVASSPAQSEVKKPVGPPVNVVMTTKDLMAMYRARREQNNLHGKK